MTSSRANLTYEEIDIQNSFYIGLGLAVSSSLFIGSSFIIKKKALVKLNRNGGLRAGSGGYGYLKEWIWWAGLFTMGIGEAANFTAYAFAPAALVTPLGALSVIVSAIMSSKFLNEKLNLLGKLGCLLCILGSTIIVIYSPKETEIESLDILYEMMLGSAFVTYVIIIIIFTIFIAFYLGPRYGKTYLIIYITFCSCIGSLTVVSCKAIGIALRNTLLGKSNDFSTWLPWVLIFVTIILILLQMDYLNRSLDIFNTSIVTPVYYVMFTSFVIIASAILFKEWSHMKTEDIFGDICGFIIVVIAVFLLNAFRDIDLTTNDIRGIFKPKYQRQNNESSISRQISREHKFNYGTNELPSLA